MEMAILQNDVLAVLQHSSVAAASIGAFSAGDATHSGIELRLHYFAEGAANVLFSINPVADASRGAFDAETYSQLKSLANGHLLRMRKGERAPHWNETHKSTPPPPFVSVRKNHEFITLHINNVIPPHHVVEHILVEVSAAVQRACNAVLSAMDADGSRPAKRHGWLINTTERFAVLVPDMTARDARNFMMEFQPKWLAQSPMAPADATRCKTCALQLKKGVSPEKRFCPLALASGVMPLVQEQIGKFMPKCMPAGWDADMVQTEIAQYFCNDSRGRDLLILLRRLQQEWDPEGILNRVGLPEDFETQSPDALAHIARDALQDPRNKGFERFSWAMTVRDCVVFVLLSKRGDEGPLEIEARLADLDLKRPDSVKLLKWAKDEMELQTHGQYTGEDAETLETPDFQETCVLARPEWASVLSQGAESQSSESSTC